MRAFAGDTHPLLRFPAELWAGKEFYTGRKLKHLQSLTVIEWVDSMLYGALPTSRAFSTARQVMDTRKSFGALSAFHFPIAFPEVFLRDRPGFDVILGNPPWDKALVEEHEFWARHSPGLRGMSQREREKRYKELRESRPDLAEQLDAEIQTARALRQALLRGPFPGMGSGHPDLYKAFCWRFWFLAAKERGRIGVVLPRSVLAAKGSEEFRRVLFR